MGDMIGRFTGGGDGSAGRERGSGGFIGTTGGDRGRGHGGFIGPAGGDRGRGVLAPWKQHAKLRRSFGLLGAFKYEQTEPAKFYGLLARDTVQLIESLWEGAGLSSVLANGGDERSPDSGSAEPCDGKPSSLNGLSLNGLKILDVGGGPGYFGVAFDEAGAEYYTCEPDVGEMSAAGIELQSSVRGSGLDLPFRSEVFDITYSSNVAEHVPEPWRMADEMLRVTRPGGIMIYSYTCWLGPFGGHETGLWEHYVGGEFAARRYAKKHGHEPKNRWGESLFDVGCGDGLNYAARVEVRRADAEQVGSELVGAEQAEAANTSHATSHPPAELLAAFPRYHPWWAWWMVRVPGLREFAVSNLVLVFRRIG